MDQLLVKSWALVAQKMQWAVGVARRRCPGRNLRRAFPLTLIVAAITLMGEFTADAPRLRCSDFTSAHQVIAAYRAGARYLDGDGDGYACEKQFNVYVGDETPAASRFRQPGANKRRGAVNPAPAGGQLSIHLLPGNPSGAGSRDLNNFLIIKPQYALSYNAAKGIPNWVSWQLNSSWLGSVDRQNDFRPDTTLPSGVEPITPSNYSGSGFDRGHQIPSADRTRSREDNSATFLMTLGNGIQAPPPGPLRGFQGGFLSVDGVHLCS